MDVTIREYAEEENVEVVMHKNGRLVIRAINEGGYNFTAVDLLDLLTWVKVNMPELLKEL